MLSERHDIDRALRSLASARRLVDEGLTETRRAVRALRTDAPPLPDALASLVDDRPCALTVIGEPYVVAPAAGLALLRVAQEAVTNAAKHADGRPPTIALDYSEHGVELRVENELSDAVPSEHPGTAGGYGLAGMHERLRLIDGELQAGPLGRASPGDAVSTIEPAGSERLRIVIADDQTVVREGLQMVLDVIPDLEVVAAVGDGEQALAAVAEHRPDAILLDLHMPVLDGVGATERLAREHPEVAIVVLTTYADDDTIIAALRAGARGYLTKNADRREISQALHSAAAGHTILPPDVTAMLLAGADSARQAKPPVPAELPDDLTPREAEVLKLLAAGLSNRES